MMRLGGQSATPTSPSERFETLERRAADELRSANAQIEYLLADAARRAGRGPRTPKRAADANGHRAE